MRPIRLTTKFTAGALGLAVLGAAVLALPAPARAEEDNVPIDTKILRGIMEGIGLRQDGEAILSYPERAPLVIPPGKTLPPPEKFDAVAAKNPAWPVDPDIQRRKEESARERRSALNADQQLLQDLPSSEPRPVASSARCSARKSQKSASSPASRRVLR